MTKEITDREVYLCRDCNKETGIVYCIELPQSKVKWVCDKCFNNKK